MTHVVGPWTVRGKTVSSIDHDTYYKVATVGNQKFTDDANAANAKLIAAAPELLEIAQMLMAYIETEDMRPLDLNKARSAIAKATGAA